MLAILVSIWTVLGAIIVATVSRVLAEDAKTFIPRFARRLLRKAANRIHEDQSEAFHEEWLAQLDDHKELTGQLVHSLSIYLWGAGRICRLVGYSEKRDLGLYLMSKRALDISIAISILPLVAFAIVPMWLLTFRDGGAGFFEHKKVGRNGRVFRCWKIRTMVPNAKSSLRDILAKNPEAAAEWVLYHKLSNDPRITGFGAFLRKYSLDELPQIWNVLVGEMSFVGPRPITRGELHRYGENGEIYLSMTPGITGLWQVSGTAEMSYNYRISLDVHYEKTRSLITDLRLIVMTGISQLRSLKC